MHNTLGQAVGNAYAEPVQQRLLADLNSSIREASRELSVLQEITEEIHRNIYGPISKDKKPNVESAEKLPDSLPIAMSAVEILRYQISALRDDLETLRSV